MSRGAQPLELLGRGRLLFTARAEGNLSSVGGDGAHEAAAARERLRASTGLLALARGYQVHGTAVHHVSELPAPSSESATPPQADGQASALDGVGMLVLSSDCMPVGLGCSSAVAMVHAGWRGLAAGVLEAGVEALAELGRGDQIVAVIGPAAGVCCYEVGEEVHAAFGGEHRRGRNIDLRAIAHERLLAAGVAEVRDVSACTICDERFFSHRREGARAGRQGGVAWLS